MASTSPAPRQHARVLATIGSGHAVSHFYLLALPPLFPLIRADLQIGYTELGLLVTLFNVATGTAQIPAGFLTDRIGARVLLLVGLAIMGVAVGLMGLAPTYPSMLLLVVIAGIGNSVVHPTDYVIMSASIEPGWLARAFSIHTFAGNVGFTLAPVTMIALATLLGWRGALMVAALLSLPVLAAIATSGDTLRDHRRGAASRQGPADAARPAGTALLFSAPILLMLMFYAFTAMVTSGVHSFSVSALINVQGIELGAANTILTAFLVTSSLGILVGGFVADRTRRYGLLTALAFAIAAVMLLLPGIVPLPALVLGLLFGVAGLLQGAVRPARDMMVRAVAPEAATGRVFAFVMTGLNLGAALTPLLFGLILDLGDPRLLFWLLAVFFGFAIAVIGVVRQLPPGVRPPATRAEEVAAE